jgi:transposase
MMGPRQVEQGALFYNFSLDRHVPADHTLRAIDRFVDLSSLRHELAPFYSSTGRPSVDPELRRDLAEARDRLEVFARLFETACDTSPPLIPIRT